MGLEYVEFFMDIEYEFDIRISDEDSQELHSCEDVAKYVIAHVPATKLIQQSRIPQKRFYRLRNALMREFALPRHAIRPKTPWEQLLTGDTKTQWEKLKKIPEINYLPGLKSDSNIPLFSTIFTITLFFVLLIAVDLSFWPALGLALITWFSAYYFLFPEGDQIPESCQTVGALVPNVHLPLSLSSSQSSEYIPQSLPHNDDDLMYAYTLRRVIQIAAEVMGIDENLIRPDAHLYRDLAMGG